MRVTTRLILSILAAGQIATEASYASEDPPSNPRSAPPVLSSTNHASLKATVRREEGPGLVPVTRAYLDVGSNKFGFQIPTGFRTQTSSNNRVTLIGKDFGCLITVRLLGPLPEGSRHLTHDMYRNKVLNDNLASQILAELGVAAMGQGGPAFDLQGGEKGGVTRRTLIAFVPSNAGVLEFTLACNNPEALESARQAFNLVLSTLRQNDPTGKLHMPEIRSDI